MAKRLKEVLKLWYLTWAFKTNSSNYNTKVQLLPTITASLGI